MANEQNLKPRCLSKEEATKMAQKSAEVRRQKASDRKTARELFISLLSNKVKTKDGKTSTYKEILIQKIVGKALGEVDLNTIKYIFDIIGEGVTQKVELTGKDGKDLMPQRLSHDEAKKIISELENEY